MPKILIIANPASGNGGAIHRAGKLAHILSKSGCQVDCEAPGSLCESQTLVGEASSNGTDVVVVAGGDGTVCSVLDQLRDTETCLAVLPSGRGNDFVRGVGLPRTVRELAGAILESRTKRIDLGEANGTLFGTVTTCGLDAEVGQLTAGGSSLGGSSGYLLQAVRSIRSFKGYDLMLEVDGVPVFEGEATLVACANTPTYGGGLRVAAGADPTDGRLDVCVVGRVSRLGAFGLLPMLALGQHVSHPVVRTLGGYDIRIHTDGSVPMLVDGEPADASCLDVGVCQGTLRVVG